jgi:hypothetical protein
MADTVTLHIATVDTNTPPYVQTPVSTIAAFAGYTSTSFRVLGAFQKIESEGEEIQYIDGQVKGSIYLRGSFDVRLVPFSYKVSLWDLSSWKALLPYLVKAKRYQHTWLELTAIGDFLGVSTPYHTAANAVPVQLTDISFEDADGFKNVTLSFKNTWYVPLT